MAVAESFWPSELTQENDFLSLWKTTEAVNGREDDARATLLWLKGDWPRPLVGAPVVKPTRGTCVAPEISLVA